MMNTVSNCLKNGTEFLNLSGVPEPRISAEALLSYVLNRPRFSLYLETNRAVEETKRLQFEALLTKRASRYPLQYLVKQVPFRNVTLEIGEGCLIPRPETEILVQIVLDEMAKRGQVLRPVPFFGRTDTVMQILDVGTGSGNIAVSLAKERPDWNVTGTDIYSEALRYAQLNARMNSVENRVRFVETDLWKDIKNESFDIIISNPPYLTSDELEMLQPEVAFEPRSSLDGGRDGLAFFRRIIRNAHAILSARGRIRHLCGGKPSGFIFFEVGLGQAESVCEFLKTNGFQNIQCSKDDSNIDRVISAQLKLHG